MERLSYCRAGSYVAVGIHSSMPHIAQVHRVLEVGFSNRVRESLHFFEKRRSLSTVDSKALERIVGTWVTLLVAFAHAGRLFVKTPERDHHPSVKLRSRSRSFPKRAVKRRIARLTKRQEGCEHGVKESRCGGAVLRKSVGGYSSSTTMADCSETRQANKTCRFRSIPWRTRVEGMDIVWTVRGLPFRPFDWCYSCRSYKKDCFKAYDWECQACGNHNYARNEVGHRGSAQKFGITLPEHMTSPCSDSHP